MPMSEAARAAASERMKKLQADKHAKKNGAPIPEDSDPALQEALAKQPIRSDANTLIQGVHVTEIAHWPENGVNSIIVEVDWENTPMPEAQSFYALLKDEFEKAGRILNARSNARTSGYTCFMCNKHFEGMPGMTDHSYQDPLTGLFPRVDICGELCVINYNAKRINERHARQVKQAEAERGA